MINKKIFFFIIVLLCITSEIFAGAWTQKKSKGYFQIGSQFVSADMAYNSNGDKFDIPKFSDVTLNLYGEFGLTDNLTLLANLPFFRSLQSDPDSGSTEKLKNSGISDSDLGLKIKLFERNQSVISATALFGIPTGKIDNVSGLWTGTEEWNQMLILEYGHSFYPTNLYFSGFIGFNNRTRGFSDELRYSFEAGYFFIENKLLLILRINGINPLRNGSNLPMGGRAGLYANNQKFLAYGPEIHYFLKNGFGFNARIESGTGVQNAASSIVYKIGISYQIK
jgi:hypothetical protein